MQNFRALGVPLPDPVPLAARGFAPKPPASGGWGLRPQTPKTAPHCEFLATRLFYGDTQKKRQGSFNQIHFSTMSTEHTSEER